MVTAQLDISYYLYSIGCVALYSLADKISFVLIKHALVLYMHIHLALLGVRVAETDA